VQLGEFLRAARERAGLTLQQVSDTTKIPHRHLAAIEHGDISVVPKGPYRRGEVSAFAQAVGVDQKVVLAQLDQALPALPREKPAPVPVEPVELGNSWGLTVLLLMAVVALTALLLWNRDASSSSSGPPVAAPSPASTATAPAQTTEVDSQAPAAPQLPADDDPVTAVSPVLVVTSNPPGARVVVDGIGRGTTPVRINYLPLGEKTVRVVHDGYVSQEQSISLTAKRPAVTLHVELKSK
jgi:cytoskeleton protein RodZ